MTDTSIQMRAIGILVIDEGVVIRAYVQDEGQTEIQINTGIRVGAIVRDSTTGLWRYDEAMRGALGIVADPEFNTDGEAGNKLESYLPPLAQVRIFIQGLIDPVRGGQC